MTQSKSMAGVTVIAPVHKGCLEAVKLLLRCFPRSRLLEKAQICHFEAGDISAPHTSWEAAPLLQ